MNPIIAVVEGFAIAGGTEILQGTDIRLASKGAREGPCDFAEKHKPV